MGLIDDADGFASCLYLTKLLTLLFVKFTPLVVLPLGLEALE